MLILISSCLGESPQQYYQNDYLNSPNITKNEYDHINNKNMENWKIIYSNIEISSKANF